MNILAELLIAGLLSVSIYMFAVWLLSIALRNSGIVDPAWSMGFTLCALLYAWVAKAHSIKQYMLISMIIIWSLRLTLHLAMRFIRWFPGEDPRYAVLKARMGKGSEGKMLWIFLWQGAVLLLMTAPLVVVMLDSRADFYVLQTVSLVIWLIALLGETKADFDLMQFTSELANKGKTCQAGLWKYSRHPNYFFEWVGSVSFAMYVSDSPYGLFAWVSPLVLLHLLLNVTGVKPAEEHSLKTRSDYADYVKTTSQFIPWIRRKSI